MSKLEQRIKELNNFIDDIYTQMCELTKKQSNINEKMLWIDYLNKMNKIHDIYYRAVIELNDLEIMLFEKDNN